MNIYRTKVKKLSGTDFHEVHKKAIRFFEMTNAKTKRRPYVRSAYFNHQKIFLGLFWHHLFEKENWRDRTRRIRFFPPALELIKNSRFEPKSDKNPNNASEYLHRFMGITPDNDLFCVQIKENKKSNQKWLISVYPI